MKREKVKILCLQETHLRPAEERWLRKLFRGEIHYATAGSRTRGVMIVIATDMPWELREKYLDKDGRFVIIKGKIGSKLLAILGIYAPHKLQTFWQEVFELAALDSDSEILMRGDFNATFVACG